MNKSLTFLALFALVLFAGCPTKEPGTAPDAGSKADVAAPAPDAGSKADVAATAPDAGSKVDASAAM